MDSTKKILFDDTPDFLIFRPSEDEFTDCIDYIRLNEEYINSTGIIKIIPPPSWKPTFNINPSEFIFKTDIQRLSDYNVYNQVKLQFNEQVKKFWEMQKVYIRIPYINGKKLDLFMLRHFVKRYCHSNDYVLENCLWRKIAEKMGLADKTNGTKFVKKYFLSILLPFMQQRKDIRMEFAKDNKLTDPKNSKEMADFIKNNMKNIDFVESSMECTLEKFTQKANAFKLDYFGEGNVSSTVIEKEFWRLVNMNDADITVETGIQLTNEESCFSNELNDFYINHKWNLKNVAKAFGSVLRYLPSEINGFTKPIKNIGMCFSTFCWHLENHWTSSIDYLHTGGSKIWYCIPPHQAELFEKVATKIAPKLFSHGKDSFQNFVTIIDPNILKSNGITTYRVVQNPGEFIITFPRAYHAGFSQGFNFSESVNFALPKWFSTGRKSIEFYSDIRQNSLFSHDELVFRISLNQLNIDYKFLDQCNQECIEIIHEEMSYRAKCFQLGIQKKIVITSKLIWCDQRQCGICKKICFFSVVKCACSKKANVVACSNHYKDICEVCPLNQLTIYFRYDTRDFLIHLVHMSDLLTQKQEQIYSELGNDSGYESGDES